MELHRFSLTVILQMVALGIVGILVVLLHFLHVTSNSFTVDLVMFLIVVGAVVLSGIVLLFPNGWRVLSWMFHIGPEPVNINLKMTSRIIPGLALIDAAGLGVLIACTGGPIQSLFTPLLFTVPVAAIILSEGKTSWRFLYFGIIVVHLISLFASEILGIIVVHVIPLFASEIPTYDFWDRFEIKKLIWYKGMSLVATGVPIGITIISYLQSLPRED